MIKEWLTHVADRGFGFLAALLMRRAVAPLVRINDDSLRESGLSRTALADFLTAPLGTDPGEFFARHEQKSPVASKQRLDNQRDARDGPKPGRRRRHRKTPSKSILNLAKENP